MWVSVCVCVRVSEGTDRKAGDETRYDTASMPNGGRQDKVDDKDQRRKRKRKRESGGRGSYGENRATNESSAALLGMW